MINETNNNKGHKHGVAAAVLTIVAAVVIVAFTWVYTHYDFKIEVVKRVPQERVFIDITVR
jgi:uncharacterized membrane protein